MTPIIFDREYACRTLFTMILLLTLTSFEAAMGQEWYQSAKYYNPAPYKADEYLQFKVKYGFIRLGTIEIRQKQLDSIRFEVIMRSRSASGLPFIDFGSFNRATLISGSSRSYNFTIDTKGSTPEKGLYRYDSSAGTVLMQHANEKEGLVRRTVSRTEPYFDGAGFIMLCRCLSGSATSVTVTTLANHDFASTSLYFGKERQNVEVAAFKTPVRARKVKSVANWKMATTAGLGGNFTLWVSDDAAAVPLVAEIGIALGSIRIELESCTRGGWSPAGSTPVNIQRGGVWQ